MTGGGHGLLRRTAGGGAGDPGERPFSGGVHRPRRADPGADPEPEELTAAGALFPPASGAEALSCAIVRSSAVPW